MFKVNFQSLFLQGQPTDDISMMKWILEKENEANIVCLCRFLCETMSHFCKLSGLFVL